MQAIACGCVLLVLGQPVGYEYKGPPYTCRGSNPVTGVNWYKREALILCVRVGVGPDRIQQLFGPPLMASRYGAGPDEWWYPRLGVSIFWPPRLLEPTGPVERVSGVIQ
jgi:hypothetical protein